MSVRSAPITRPKRRGPPWPATRADDKRKQLGPHSGIIDRGAVGLAIDARSREGRYLRVYEKLLLEHVGSAPSITQRLLIARASRIALHLELLDEKVFKTGHALTQHDFTHYCAWSNALTRMLDRLGLKSPVATAPHLSDYLANATR